MSELFESLRTDLAAEHLALDEVVRELDEAGLLRATPAEGWDVRDQLSHLAGFDEAARTAVVDPDAFTEDLARRLAEGDDPIAGYTAAGRALPPAEVVDWWRSAHRGLLAATEGLDPRTRVPWYGPPFSAVSHLTARLMETWAHGQEIYDLVGATRAPTDRLRHIATIGVKTFGWTFVNRRLEPPGPPPYVRLVAPSGAIWEWNEPSETESVRGDALEFCQVVAQTRSVADTRLEVMGPVATRWMSIAQCFAGPPVDPPKPGERSAARG